MAANEIGLERQGGSVGITEENNANKISRRDFLKIIGAAGASLALGGFAFSSFRPANNNNNNNYSASAQSYGSWQLGGQTHVTAIHVAALTNGKVIYIAGSGYFFQNELGPFRLGIYDPSTNTTQALPNTSEDMFCVGHSMLPNGNILFAGGTFTYDTRSANGKWLGLKGTWIYDVQSNTLRRIASMKHGRWYPSQVLLADGKVLIVGGYDEYGSYNKLAEIFDPATETWSIKYDLGSTTSYCAGESEDPAIMPGAGQVCYGPGAAPNVQLYPRMHLMPSGLVALCGQSKTMRMFNPATGVWNFAGNMLLGGSRGYGTSVLLPLQNTTAERGNILLFGGTVTADSFATTTAEIVTPNGTALQPRWTASSAFGRKHPIPVILPDGKILAIGGTAYQNSSANKIMAPELFDPVTETWTTLPAMTVPRLYHSAGVLLRDGRVWTAGTTPSRTTSELRVEYFLPSYYSSAARPAISGTPTVGGYGQTITIPTPDGLNIDAVSLVMLSSETHAYNSDQRLVWLQIQSKTATQVVVLAPINGSIAPPSYYYLHVLKKGVPSVAAIVKIPGNAAPPPPPPPGNFVSIYSVTGANSYGTMASTGAATDITGIGEKLTSSSSLVGSPIKRVAVVLKKTGNTTGTIYIRIRNSSDAIAKELGTINATALTTADQRFELTASTSYTLQANDKVLAEWSGTGSLADMVSVKRSGVDAFNAGNAYFVARKTNGTYTNSPDRDLAGDWYKQV